MMRFGLIQQEYKQLEEPKLKILISMATIKLIAVTKHHKVKIIKVSKV